MTVADNMITFNADFDSDRVRETARAWQYREFHSSQDARFGAFNFCVQTAAPYASFRPQVRK